MTPQHLLQTLKASGVTLSSSGNRLHVSGPKSALTQETVAAIRREKAALIRLLAPERAIVLECRHPEHGENGLWKWRSRFGERGMFACVVCWPPVVDADQFGGLNNMVRAGEESEVS